MGVGAGMGACKDASLSASGAWETAGEEGQARPVVIIWTLSQSCVLGWPSWRMEWPLEPVFSYLLKE